MTRALLIVDRYDAAAFQRVAAAAGDGSCDVLLLGLSAEWFCAHYAGALPASVAWRVVDTATFAAKACEQVGQFVVATIPGLPDREFNGRTLGGLLARRGRTDWWLTETSEKGPYRGALIGQLYRLAMLRLVLDQAAYTQVWYCVEDALLDQILRVSLPASSATAIDCPHVTAGPPLVSRPLLRYWIHAARAFFLSAIAATVSLLVAPRDVPRGGEATFTVFPGWWAPRDSPSPRERFFSPRASSPTSQLYFAWLTGGVWLWRARKRLRDVFAARHIVPLQRFVRVIDLLATLSPSGFLRLVTFERRIRPSIQINFQGFAVGALIGADISRSLTGAEWFQDQLLERAAARATAYHRPARILYRAEFQPIEHALLRGIEEGGAVPALGFVHFPFGARYLSMRFASSETAAVGKRTTGTRLRPMPAGLLAIGPAASRHAVEAGFPSQRIAVCGPQRYGGLIAAKREPVSRAARRERLGLSPGRPLILVALAILDADGEALCAAMSAAQAAFADAMIMIRPHPNQPEGTGPVTALLKAWGPDRARLMPVDEGLYDVLGACDALVCIGSMIAFEATALDVMPIVFENPSTYAATSLREFERGLFVVNGAQELAEAVTAVRINSEDARKRRAQWPALLEDVFGDLESPLDAQMDEATAALVSASRDIAGLTAEE